MGGRGRGKNEKRRGVRRDRKNVVFAVRENMSRMCEEPRGERWMEELEDENSSRRGGVDRGSRSAALTSVSCSFSL